MIFYFETKLNNTTIYAIHKFKHFYEIDHL